MAKKKVDPSAIAVQAIEAQPAFGQIKPMRGQVLACAEQHLGDVPANDRLKQEAPHSRRRKRKPGVQKGGPLSPNRQKPAHPSQPREKSADEITRLNRSVREDRDVAISNDALISCHANREITDAHSHPPAVVAPFGG